MHKIFFMLCFHLITIKLLQAQQPKTWKEFYPGGQLKSIKHEGLFNGCNMAIGTDSIFYPSGELLSTISYNNMKGKHSAGCHDTRTIATSIHYSRTGRQERKSQQKYSYEGTACDCGTWVSTDTQGKETKKQYSDCFDETPCQPH